MRAAQHPSVRLAFTPTAPDFEKLSRIILGRLPTDGGVDTALLFKATGSILGGNPAASPGSQIATVESAIDIFYTFNFD